MRANMNLYDPSQFGMVSARLWTNRRELTFWVERTHRREHATATPTNRTWWGDGQALRSHSTGSKAHLKITQTQLFSFVESVQVYLNNFCRLPWFASIECGGLVFNGKVARSFIWNHKWETRLALGGGVMLPLITIGNYLFYLVY